MTRHWISCKANFRPGHMVAPDPNEQLWKTLLCFFAADQAISLVRTYQSYRRSEDHGCWSSSKNSLSLFLKKLSVRWQHKLRNISFIPYFLFFSHHVFKWTFEKTNFENEGDLLRRISLYFIFLRRFFSFQHKKNFSQQLWNLENKRIPSSIKQRNDLELLKVFFPNCLRNSERGSRHSLADSCFFWVGGRVQKILDIEYNLLVRTCSYCHL